MFSTLIAGGGFRGGRVVGASDERGMAVAERPIHPTDLVGAIYERLGIDGSGQTTGGFQDADDPTGPTFMAGDTAEFIYLVTNPGEVALGNVVVTDDAGTPGDNSDDYNPTPVLDGSGFNVGDLNVTQQALQDLQTRTKLLRTFDRFRRDVDRQGTMSALDKFNERAVAMLTSPRTAEAFNLSKEPDELRERYGRTTWGQGLLLARRLVESGVRFVQQQAGCRLSKAAGK